MVPIIRTEPHDALSVSSLKSPIKITLMLYTSPKSACRQFEASAPNVVCLSAWSVKEKAETYGCLAVRLRDGCGAVPRELSATVPRFAANDV